ncbi:MAG: exo-alpha-sialidase [Clostridia bacterium]|nr:exo-alpha-sialidase [Clostridia bacterium]
MRILANELAIPFRAGWECHASHLTVLDDGSVFCVFFHGSVEGRDDVRIYGAFRRANGKWQYPFAISEDDGIAHWNPVLHRKKDGTYVLYYKIGKTTSTWKTYYRTSTDECKTWSAAQELVPGDESGGRGPVRNKMIYLSDGSLLAGASSEQGEWRCFFDRSFDDGKTWQKSVLLSIASDMREKHDTLDNKGIIQPTLWESESGAHALMRSSEGRIYRTDSKDFTHWCQPYAIDVPHNNKAIDIVRLPDGRLILACNPTANKDHKIISPLSLLVSKDDGKTFSLYTHLSTMEGRNFYPALQYENGHLHITYTFNRYEIVYMCLDDL